MSLEGIQAMVNAVESGGQQAFAENKFLAVSLELPSEISSLPCFRSCLDVGSRDPDTNLHPTAHQSQ